MDKYMKILTLTAIVAGLVVLPLILRKPKAQKIPVSQDKDKRYDVNDDMVDWDL
jgi:hypothetical protein